MEVDAKIKLKRVPNDPFYGSDPWDPATALTYLPTMNAPGAWDVTTGSREIKACVIDSGLDVNHPDLKDNLASPPGINVIDVDPDNWPNMKFNPNWYTQVGAASCTCCAALGGAGVWQSAGARPWRARLRC